MSTITKEEMFRIWNNRCKAGLDFQGMAGDVNRIITTHAPKITAEDVEAQLCILLGNGTAKDLLGEGYDERVKACESFAANITAPKAPAQEQEWEYFTGAEGNDAGWSRQQDGIELQCTDGSWTRAGRRDDSPFYAHGKYRRPRQPQQAGKERPEWMPSTPRDWTEDYPHENGNYECHCVKCGKKFYGHKRRVICKPCATRSQPQAR